MMPKKVLSLILALSLGSVVAAQDLGSFEEVTAGNLFGLGARQMAMGGTGIASSLDGSALYYNPAALTQIHRIEFQIGLNHQNYSNITRQSPEVYSPSLGLRSILGRSEIDQSKTRLGSLNLTVPVPTYRGSLVVAFGVHRIMSFDRPALLDVLYRNDGGQEVAVYEKEFDTDGIYLYSGGVGIELSPNVSAGLALNVYSGKRKINYDYRYSDETNNLADGVLGQINEDYIGAAFKGGLMIRPNSRLSIGLTAETPVDWQVKQSWFEERYARFGEDISTTAKSGSAEYDLKRPFVFGAGVSYRIRKLILTGDIEYVDWSQSAYGDNPEMSLKNDSLPLFYRDVVNIRLGIEYQIPRAGLAFRGGFAVLPLANDKGVVRNESLNRMVLVDQIQSDRAALSLGFGWLIDRVILLELAYVRSGYKLTYSAYNSDLITTRPATRDDVIQQVFATFSYRY